VSFTAVLKSNYIYFDKHSFVLLYEAMVRPHLEYANSYGFHVKKRDIEKVQKRATKLIIFLKHLPYTDRLQQLLLSTLKYRRFSGDMIDVLVMVCNRSATRKHHLAT